MKGIGPLWPTAVLLAGCCARPSSAWDRTTLVVGPQTPSGVVLIVDRKAEMPNMPICTGAVFQEEQVGATFRAYVLTAKHCIENDEPRRWGITAPAADARVAVTAAGLADTTILEATPVATGTDGLAFPYRWLWPGTIDWVDDWAILAVDSPSRLPVLPLFIGDPPVAPLAPGASVSLVAFHDVTFVDHRTAFMELHEHPFGWTGVPADVAQGGHSGAPIVHEGRVVAVFLGEVVDSYACRLFCGTWPTKLRLVNVETVRREAATAGFQFLP